MNPRSPLRHASRCCKSGTPLRLHRRLARVLRWLDPRAPWRTGEKAPPSARRWQSSPPRAAVPEQEGGLEERQTLLFQGLGSRHEKAASVAQSVSGITRLPAARNLPKTTRFAGLEIGNTKLAALAMNAHRCLFPPSFRLSLEPAEVSLGPLLQSPSRPAARRRRTKTKLRRSRSQTRPGSRTPPRTRATAQASRQSPGSKRHPLP